MNWLLAAAVVYAAVVTWRYVTLGVKYADRGQAINDVTVHAMVSMDKVKDLRGQVAYWKAEAERSHEACARKIKRF